MTVRGHDGPDDVQATAVKQPALKSLVLRENLGSYGDV
jgi:hypothetical protein